MVVYSSGAGSGQFASAKETDKPYDPDRQIFHVKDPEGAPYAVSIEKKASNINGEDCFILYMDHLSLLWVGKEASEGAKAAGRKIAGVLSGDGSKPLEMDEGEEMPDFWEQLGGQGEYPEKRPSVPTAGAAKLYRCGTGEHEFVGMSAIEKKDMADDSVYVLDTDESVFVWVGETAADQSVAESIRRGQRFKATNPGNFGTNVPVVVVKAGHEHADFISHFKNWNVVEAEEDVSKVEAPPKEEEDETKEEATEETPAVEPVAEETKAEEEKEEPEAITDEKPAIDDEVAIVSDEEEEEEEDRAEEEILAGEAKITEDVKAAETSRISEEEKAAAEAADKERLAKEVEEKATEEARLAEEKATEEKRLVEEKAAEEKRLAEEKAAEEKRLVEEKAAEEKRLAEEKATEEKRLVEKKAAEEKRLTKEKAAEERRKEDEKRLEEARKKAEAEEEEEKKQLEVEAAKLTQMKDKSPQQKVQIEFNDDVKSSLEGNANGKPPLSPEEKKSRGLRSLKERSSSYLIRTKPLHEQKNKGYVSPMYSCDDDLSVSLPREEMLTLSSKITDFYPLTELKEAKEGVNFKHREMYLSNEDFETSFEMDKEEFYELPKWKRENSKRKLGLF